MISQTTFCCGHQKANNQHTGSAGNLMQASDLSKAPNKGRILVHQLLRKVFQVKNGYSGLDVNFCICSLSRGNFTSLAANSRKRKPRIKMDYTRTTTWHCTAYHLP
jgi:hypothetical protein